MNLLKILKTSKLCLKYYFYQLCHNPPIEIIDIIMQLMVDAIRLTIHCHEDNYNIIIHGNVYGIPHEGIKLTKTACTNLYKIPCMENVKKMVSCDSTIVYLTYRGDVYVKNAIPLRSSIPVKVASNILDINYNNKDIFFLNHKHDLMVDDEIILKNVVQFSCGKQYTIAITTKGCYSWGVNNRGQLGLNDRVYRDKPTLISLEGIKMVTCGTYHTAALSKNEVYTWGENKYGQLGNPNVPIRTVLKKPAKLDLHNIIDIKCTRKNTLFLNQSHNVFITKENDIEPIPISNIIMIDAHQNTIMLMTKSLNIYTLVQHIFHFND